MLFQLVDIGGSFNDEWNDHKFQLVTPWLSIQLWRTYDTYFWAEFFFLEILNKIFTQTTFDSRFSNQSTVTKNDTCCSKCWIWARMCIKKKMLFFYFLFQLVLLCNVLISKNLSEQFLSALTNLINKCRKLVCLLRDFSF